MDTHDTPETLTYLVSTWKTRHAAEGRAASLRKRGGVTDIRIVACTAPYQGLRYRVTARIEGRTMSASNTERATTCHTTSLKAKLD